MSYDVSDDFRLILGADGGRAFSRYRATRCEILLDGKVEFPDLKIESAKVKYDSQAATRRTVSGIKIVDSDGSLTPDEAGALLDPLLGAEIRLWMGVDHQDTRPSPWGRGLELVPSATCVL